jgi:two-component system phosphate regulon sensor histidine kinase PhoR
MFNLGLDKYSLRVQYLFFTAIVSLIIIVGFIWIAYSTYSSFETSYAEDVSAQGQEIQSVFDEKVFFIEHFLQFIGSQIKNSKTTDVGEIASMIRYHGFQDDEDAITWNMVNYITPDGYLSTDSKYGIREPIQIGDKRDWLKHAQAHPWKLQFSAPDIGFITGDYTLPAGIAIYDDNMKFYGLLSSSISIEKLTTNLVQFIGDNIVIALFNDAFNSILISDPFVDEKKLNDIVVSYKDTLAEGSNTRSIIALKDNIKVGNVVFSHYVHSTKFPFWFLIGFDKNLYSKDLWSEIIPKLLANLALWMIFSGILIYLSYQVVRPIMILGKAANNISHGKRVELPSFKAKELNLLAKQLNTISKIHSSLRSKQSKLYKINSELSTANEFIKSNMSFLSHELINPTSSIVEFSKLLSKKIADELNDEEAKSYLSIINRASIHLNKQLNFFVKVFKFQAERKHIEEKPVLLKQLIDWNLSMIMHHVNYKRVTIKSEVEPNISLLGDEIMIGQVVQNIAANGAKYNKENGTLLVKAFINKAGQIEIHFIDTGIGISKQELGIIFKIFKRSKTTKKSKVVGYGVGLAYVQRCVEAHGGRISVSSKRGQGTKFKIVFPKERTVDNLRSYS